MSRNEPVAVGRWGSFFWPLGRTSDVERVAGRKAQESSSGLFDSECCSSSSTRLELLSLASITLGSDSLLATVRRWRRGGSREGGQMLRFLHRCVPPLALTLLAAAAFADEVTLPLAQFEALRERAEPSPTPTPAPAMPVTLDAAHVEIVAHKDSARISQEFTVTILADGWQSLEMPARGTFVAAELGELEGRVSAADGWWLKVRGRGRHVVQLESLVSLRQEEASTRHTSVLSLELPRAAVVDGAVRAGDGVEEVVFVAGAVARGRDPDGAWRFAARGGTTLRLNLLGRAVAPERDSLPLRFAATTAALLRVSRTQARVTVWLRAEVHQGLLNELQVRVPSAYQVVGVGGGTVAGWDMDNDLLTVTLLEPTSGTASARITLLGEAGETITSPVVPVEGAVHTLTATAVTVEGDGLLELEELRSGRVLPPADHGRLSSDLPRKNLVVFVVDDSAQAPLWRLTWAESTEVLAAQVDRMQVHVLAGEAGMAAYQVWAEVRSSGAPSLTFSLPADFRLVRAGRDGSQQWPGISAEGLVIPLTAASDTQVIHLEGLLPLSILSGRGTMTVPLPHFSAPAGRVEARLVFPPGHRYELAQPGREGCPKSPPAGDRSTGTASHPLVEHLRPGAANDGAYSARPLQEPAGHQVVLAAWSALSATPEPLKIKVEGDRIAREWF
jgi:hypothetical protein